MAFLKMKWYEMGEGGPLESTWKNNTVLLSFYFQDAMKTRFWKVFNNLMEGFQQDSVMHGVHQIAYISTVVLSGKPQDPGLTLKRSRFTMKLYMFKSVC